MLPAQAPLDPWPLWLTWRVTPEFAGIFADVDQIEGEAFQLALTEVLAHAVTPSSDLIVNRLSRGHISQNDARSSFGAFACLLGLPSNQEEQAEAICTGGVTQRPLVGGTVQRLEELQRSARGSNGSCARPTSISRTRPTGRSSQKFWPCACPPWPCRT